MTNVNPSLVQQVLGIAERKWESNVHHDRQADDLGAALKVLEGVCFRHRKRYETALSASSKFVLKNPVALSFLVPEPVGQDRVFAVAPGKDLPPTIHASTAAVRQSFGGFSVVAFETVKGRSGDLPPRYGRSRHTQLRELG
jgi:hypothetical protein